VNLKNGNETPGSVKGYTRLDKIKIYINENNYIFIQQMEEQVSIEKHG
jgi:hypothetical protein